jgi:hypothetical protein
VDVQSEHWRPPIRARIFLRPGRVAQEAIRVCGGRAFLKRYPLERYARDARAAALMRPWTQELATQQAWETALSLDGQARGGAGA